MPMRTSTAETYFLLSSACWAAAATRSPRSRFAITDRFYRKAKRSAWRGSAVIWLISRRRVGELPGQPGFHFPPGGVLVGGREADQQRQLRAGRDQRPENQERLGPGKAVHSEE